MLQRPRTMGGMALPNFMFYYWAANIRAMLYWVNNDVTVPVWSVLEGASVRSTSLSALLCAKLPFAQPISHFTSNPIIKIWNQFRRSFSLKDIPQAAPIAKNHMFTPSMMDDTFDVWSRKDLISLSDLYVDGTFASFKQITFL